MRVSLGGALFSRRITVKKSKLVVAASIVSVTIALGASAQAQPASGLASDMT
jgi:hypothetical protein